MANPSVRSSSRAPSGTGTEPTGAASGDILVAWVSSNSTLPTAPSGWLIDIDRPWSGAVGSVELLETHATKISPDAAPVGSVPVPLGARDDDLTEGFAI